MIYEAFPLDVSPERAEIVSDLMRRVAATDTIFSDVTCEARCIHNGVNLEAMCETCARRMQIIAAALTAPTSRAWEVWCSNGAEMTPSGMILLTDISPGLDAKGHYVFFDERLGDKTEVLQDVIAWIFADHEGWDGLARLTIEVPAPFVALARHATRRLGFGGAFKHRVSERLTLQVEGVKRGAVKWRGTPQDVLVLGLLAPERTHSVPTSRDDTSTQEAQPVSV